MKNIRVFYLKLFQFLVLKLSIYLNRRVSVMKRKHYETLLSNAMVTESLQISTEKLYFYGNNKTATDKLKSFDYKGTLNQKIYTYEGESMSN